MTFENGLSFKCLQVVQPIGTFYVGSMSNLHLARVAYSDVRRLERRGVEEYLGIERPLAKARVAELRKYVNTVDACFPASIILALSPEHAEYDSEAGIMHIKNEPDVAKIIDGQHRIAGLEGFTGSSFQVSVTIFVDMDLEDQATVFATINLKQTKVTKSLAYDLFEYAQSRSPQKTCHNIAKFLNSKDGSPFLNKIKILGLATGKPEESITQATFVDRLVGYLSPDMMRDRDDLKRGKKISRAEGAQQKRLIFRNLFVDEQDAYIAKIVWNYFEAVSRRWPTAWKENRKGHVLNRTTGFSALMRFLRPAYNSLASNQIIVETIAFEQLFTESTLGQDSFTTAEFVPGAIGETALYRRFCQEAKIQD